MPSVAAIAYLVGQFFLLVTAGTALYAAWRRRDSHHLDILVVVGSLSVVSLVRGRPQVLLHAFAAGLLLTQQYFLLRLVRHFRDVPALLLRGAALAISAGIIVILAWRRAPSATVDIAMSVYIVAIQGYAALAFTREFAHTGGVTARRLIFAGVGTWTFAAAYVIAALAGWLPSVGRLGANVNEVLTAGTLACYFFAFATPRVWRAAWQRVEQAQYLSATADRDPEERGARAADDLNRAASRSVGNAVTLVALRDSPAALPLAVRAATDPSLLDLEFLPADGAIGRACRLKEAVTGRPADCEAEVAARLAPFGASVLVAPIATQTHTWGVVAVVQRRGSLFPEDDLRLLAQLGRYAATALDHAQLIAEARTRARQAAHRRLREVESRMSQMLDSIKDYAMVVLDQHGHVAAWHAGAQHVFGRSADEVIDQSAAMLFDMTPHELQALLDAARQGGHAEREGPCLRRDGTRFTGATTVRPLAAEEGQPPGFVAVTRDVTERRDLEDRLRQSQKMEAIGQLAGGIAHDFNNLLTAILGYADWLEEHLDEDDARRQEVQEIQKAAERAASLTRQLLAFSRRQLLQAAPLDLSELVQDLLPMLRRVIHERIEIVDQTTPAVAPVLGDRGQVEQIVINLAVNARDAMPYGGRLTIRTADVRLDQAVTAGDASPGPYVLLEVADTGVGMDEATRRHSFEPFFTTKEVGRGTGLGLATVYGIVKQMGGFVRLQSELHYGSTFRLYFPPTAAERGAAAAPPAAARGRGHETFLLVEDDEAVRTFLTRALERHGYTIIAAERPETALHDVRARDVDLVIADVVLPGRTGLDVVRDLTRARPELPALFISGYADGVLAREGEFPRASHFLQKPFSVADLLAKIREILPAR